MYDGKAEREIMDQQGGNCMRKRTNRRDDRQRFLRLYSAIVTGALAEVTTAIGLWAFSRADIIAIAVWALAAYTAGMAAVMWATEPKNDKRKKRREAVFVTLVPEGYRGIPVDGMPDYLELVPLKKQA